MSKISIIIPTMQSNLRVFKKLLAELNENVIVGEIIIINNSLKPLDLNFDKIKLITPEKNLYVNPSWNLGIKESKYEYYGLLNDDLLLPTNIIEEVINFIDKTNNVGIIGLDPRAIAQTKEEDFDTYPESKQITFEKIENSLSIIYFGAAMFGKTKDYNYIPEKMKIWCGDNYLLKTSIDNNKTCYCIGGFEIKHLESATVRNPIFEKILKEDLLYYAQKCDPEIKTTKIYKKRCTFLGKIQKILQQIFSIQNSRDKSCKIITILGKHITIKNKE